MVSREEGRVQVQAALARHLLETGLSRTSLRQLAAAAGISDRMLLYYYTDKAEALSAAMTAVAAQLGNRLADAMPGDDLLSPRELVAVAARFTVGPDTRPVMRLWIEVVAAAARGEAPFPELSSAIAKGFIEWAEARLDPAGLADPRATAAGIIALIDGLAVVAVCADEALVLRAAETLAELA